MYTNVFLIWKTLGLKNQPWMLSINKVGSSEVWALYRFRWLCRDSGLLVGVHLESVA